MERAALIAALVIYLFTSVRWYRRPREGDDFPKLLHARVTEKRTVEIWRRGLHLDIRVFDRH